MDDPLFHPLVMIDEEYLRGRCDSVGVDLTDEQLIQVADELENKLESEHVVSEIHEYAEAIIERVAGVSDDNDDEDGDC